MPRRPPSKPAARPPLTPEEIARREAALRRALPRAWPPARPCQPPRAGEAPIEVSGPETPTANDDLPDMLSRTLLREAQERQETGARRVRRPLAYVASITFVVTDLDDRDPARARRRLLEALGRAQPAAFDAMQDACDEEDFDIDALEIMALDGEGA